MVACSTGENMLRGWMPKDLTDLTRGCVDTEDGVEVARLPALSAPIFELGCFDLPNHDLAIFAGRCNGIVAVRRPVGIENGSGVATSQRNDVWEFEGNCAGDSEGGRCGQNGKCSSSRRVPVDTDVFLI